MTSVRASRVAEQIKKEVSQILPQEVKDPRVGFITITAVDVSNDLRYAKIYFSALGNKEQKEETLGVLNGAKSFVRTEIGKRIRLRFTPEISFLLDESLDRGARIEKLLAKVRQGDET